MDVARVERAGDEEWNGGSNVMKMYISNHEKFLIVGFCA
jgi:hypothetical protein